MISVGLSFVFGIFKKWEFDHNAYYAKFIKNRSKNR